MYNLKYLHYQLSVIISILFPCVLPLYFNSWPLVFIAIQTNISDTGAIIVIVIGVQCLYCCVQSAFFFLVCFLSNSLSLLFSYPGRPHCSPPPYSPLHPRPVYAPPVVQAPPYPTEERQHRGHPWDPLHPLCSTWTPGQRQLPGLSKRTPARELRHRYAHPGDPHSWWLRLRWRWPMWTLP